MDDSQARFAAMLAGFMSDVKTPEVTPAETGAPPPKAGSPYRPNAPVAASGRDASDSVAELTLNDDVDDNPEDRVVDPSDDMYRESVTARNDSNAELPPALRKAMANAKASVSANDTPAAAHPPPPLRPPPAAVPIASTRSPTPPRSISPPAPRPASPPAKSAMAHPPLSSSSSSALAADSSSSSAVSPPSSPGSAAPSGPVYKTIMVNGPNGEKREMKIIAINPGKPLLTSEGISSKPTGYGGGSKGWVDDDETTKCMRCPNDFSVTNRRHHCRACGFVVCGTCSNHTEVLQGSDERHRVCFHCFFEIAKTGKRPYPIDRPGEVGGAGGLDNMFAFSKKERD